MKIVRRHKRLKLRLKLLYSTKTTYWRLLCLNEISLEWIRKKYSDVYTLRSNKIYYNYKTNYYPYYKTLHKFLLQSNKLGDLLLQDHWALSNSFLNNYYCINIICRFVFGFWIFRSLSYFLPAEFCLG